MDVRMPDGTIITNVPDGITQAELLARYQGVESKPTSASMSAKDKFLTGVMDPIQGGAQFLEKAVGPKTRDTINQFNNWLSDKTGLVARLPEGGVDQQTREREANYNAARTAAGESGMDWWRLAGNVASPANLAVGSRIPAAATLGKQVAIGMGAGAANAALSPVTEGDFWTEKGKQAAVGSATGGAIPVAAAGLSRVVSPAASTNPNLKMLRESGVKPTIGQTLGGWMNTTEEKASSLPIFGDAIRWARSNARDQFNEATINRALEPLGKTVKGSGQDAIHEAHNVVSDAYNAAKNQLGAFQLDRQGVTELANLKAMATNGFAPKEANRFNAAWARFQQDLSPNGHITADNFKKFDEFLNGEISKFSNATDGYQRDLGDALKEFKRVVFENAKRANPDAAEAIRKADAAFARMVRVENASNAAKLTQGNFTPGQLLQGVKQADRTVRDNATAQGQALMQDWANAGQSVLGNKYPDSGTWGRAALGLAGLGSGALNLAIPSALVGGAVAYTPPLQGLLRGAVSSRPDFAQPAAQAIRDLAPWMIPVASQESAGLLNQ